MEGRKENPRGKIADLTRWRTPLVDAIRTIFRVGVVVDFLDKAVVLERSLPHGHVATALGTERAVGLERILQRAPSRERSLALAATVACVTAPDSKLTTARRLSSETADSSLGTMLEHGPDSWVERAFGCTKSDPGIRPFHVQKEEHVRAR